MSQAPTRLKKSRDEARGLLLRRIDEARGIANDVRSQPEWDLAVAREKRWREYNVHLLESLFTRHQYADEYSGSVKRLHFLHELDPSLETLKSRLAVSVTSQITQLQSIIDRLELIEESAGPRSERPPDKASLLVMLAERFHLVARQMQKRHVGRSTLEVKDEYDAQDLFDALLKIFYDDIRPEEWTPTYAGKAGKIDFVLPVEYTAVELKITREGRAEKQIGDELLIDIGRYKSRPDVRALYCIVYDPDGHISNARGFESDLSRIHDNCVVRVMIVPKGT
jgi:hypothetical protein